MKVLVTGGVRSGKSFHAESLLLMEPGVTYLAPAPTSEEERDPDWAARIEAHQGRRPGHWETLETRDLASAIREGDGALIIDSLGTWLTSQIDELDGWNAIREEWERVLLARLDDAVDALARTKRTVVLVTNEVGMGIIPERRSGRIFGDLLGIVNQRFAAECDEVQLVVAGRALTL
ncbi:bifunctional adenosylcobinamide kinase/adenosylcobinamide-phosphate guanylyltransferase [Aeromicrobium sp.]|uniref:bifunctional adenosylcobinamide kinase/adenosylcobinamide-phosphate guanylyltransferase n=1 Tax=Aeromicrobium sp. TaxID=1871063 RepID=UPI003D6AAA61